MPLPGARPPADHERPLLTFRRRLTHQHPRRPRGARHSSPGTSTPPARHHRDYRMESSNLIGAAASLTHSERLRNHASVNAVAVASRVSHVPRADPARLASVLRRRPFETEKGLLLIRSMSPVRRDAWAAAVRPDEAGGISGTAPMRALCHSVVFSEAAAHLTSSLREFAT